MATQAETAAVIDDILGPELEGHFTAIERQELRDDIISQLRDLGLDIDEEEEEEEEEDEDKDGGGDDAPAPDDED